MNFTSYRDKDLFDTRHGGAFDRGSADSYYSRGVEPHYYVGGTAVSEKVTKLTEKEVAEYMAGYTFNEQFGDKKSWD
jgi:hypothetical protein